MQDSPHTTHSGPSSLTTHVKLLQKVVIKVGDEVLMLRRSASEHTRPEKWDLPGGNSEWPESLVDLSNPHVADWVREVQEETQIELSAEVVSQARICHFGTYFEANIQRFAVIAGWAVELEQKPEVVISHEHSEYAWMKVAEVATLDFGFADDRNSFIQKMVDGATIK
jgi:8-oxo-dGTP pyrophosphatase MutT (NUDIX family)